MHARINIFSVYLREHLRDGLVADLSSISLECSKLGFVLSNLLHFVVFVKVSNDFDSSSFFITE